MQKVMIVDDETFIIEHLKNLIDWEDIGYTVVSTAYNGKVALEKLKINNVDIIITDIKMPVMDGLQLIETLYNEYPQIKVIVLSAYDDFAIVREAFKFRIFDYFLKTEITPAHLTEILNRIKIPEKNNILTYEFIKQKYVLDSLKGKKPALSKKDLGYINLNFEIKSIIKLKIANYYNLLTCNWSKDEEIFNYAINNVITEVLYQFPKNEMFYIDNGEYVILQSDAFSVSKVHSAIKNALATCFNSICHFGISNNCLSLQDMFNESIVACSYCFYEEGNALVFYKDITKPQKLNTVERISKLRDILNEHASRIDNIDNILLYSLEAKKYAINSVFELYHKLFSLLQEYYYKFEIEDLSFPVDYDVLKKEHENLTSLNQALKSYILRLLEVINHENPIIRKVKTIVSKEYSQIITLEGIADRLNVNPSYLSRTFNKVTNTNFNSYLNKIRIENALKLIKNSNYKLYEISYMVGYSTPELFSRNFKKVMGYNPKNFR